MSQASDARRIHAMVRAIVRHHFGQSPKRIAPVQGGLTNTVYRFEHTEGRFIVRISDDPAKINAFIKEQWATQEAKKAGVPVQEILEVGNQAVPDPYMIVRETAGTEATHHPERFQVLREMGQLLARIHTIRTSGFGETFDWSANALSRNETWQGFLKNELGVSKRLEILQRHRMLSKTQVAAIRSTLRATDSWNRSPRLNHGDMRLKNVLVNEEGKITAVLDWEHCLSSVAPYWDLSVALHDLSIDAKEELLAGYDISGRQLVQIAPLIKALNAINYAPYVERIAQQKDRAGLARLRTRLSGALDLNCL